MGGRPGGGMNLYPSLRTLFIHPPKGSGARLGGHECRRLPSLHLSAAPASAPPCRLFPSGSEGVERVVVRGKQGVRVGGYLLPRGTRVEIHTYSMQRGWWLWGDDAER